MQSKHILVGVYKRLHSLRQKYSKKAGCISCEADVLALFSSSFFLIADQLGMPRERDRLNLFFPDKKQRGVLRFCGTRTMRFRIAVDSIVRPRRLTNV